MKGQCRGGSKPRRKKSKPHQRLEGHTMLYNDYFADEATQADNFWKRYWMGKDVFMEIIHDVREYNGYFKLKHDTSRKHDTTIGCTYHERIVYLIGKGCTKLQCGTRRYDRS
jgi:hypothetical protein